jgi:hypothetical protein
VPTQERAGLDDVQGMRPCRVEASEQEHDYTIAVLDPRMIYGAAKHDELLAQQRVLYEKVRPRPHQVPSGVCRNVATDELGLRKPRIASRMPRAQPAILAFSATWLLANMVSRIPLGVGSGISHHEA